MCKNGSFALSNQNIFKSLRDGGIWITDSCLGRQTASETPCLIFVAKTLAGLCNQSIIIITHT